MKVLSIYNPAMSCNLNRLSPNIWLEITKTSPIAMSSRIARGKANPHGEQREKQRILGMPMTRSISPSSMHSYAPTGKRRQRCEASAVDIGQLILIG